MTVPGRGRRSRQYSRFVAQIRLFAGLRPNELSELQRIRCLDHRQTVSANLRQVFISIHTLNSQCSAIRQTIIPDT
jgi:hypothetical protein